MCISLKDGFNEVTNNANQKEINVTSDKVDRDGQINLLSN